MSEITLFNFMRFGDRKYLEDLRDNGTIYMNTIHHFKEIEQNTQKKDKHEGAEQLKQIDWIKLEIDGKTLELRKDAKESEALLKSAQLRMYNPELSGNIYCLFAITPEIVTTSKHIDPQNAEFGDSFMVMFNPKIFVERVEQALKDRGIEYQRRLVNYYDEVSYNGNLGVFHKPMRYKHQSEFRIYAKYDKNEPLIFNIDPIPESMFIYDSSQLANFTWQPKKPDTQ